MTQKEMEHIVAHTIYVTRDYDRFTYYEGNRSINPSKVKNLLKSFNERHYPVPIVVDEKMQVLEGQHRLESAKKGGFPVFYLILEGDINPTQVIRQLNSEQTAFSLADYLKLYAEDDRGAYIHFQNLYNHYDEMLNDLGFTKKAGGPHRLVFTSLLGLLCGRDSIEGRAFLRHASNPWNRGIPKLTQIFREGSLSLKHTSRGIETLDYLLRLLAVLPRQRLNGKYHRNAYVLLRTREYLASLHYLLHYRNTHIESENEVFDRDVFLEQATLHPRQLLPLANSPKEWTDALKHIEEIYNYKRGSRKYIYLASV
jgi:hypothetical protein